MLWRRIHLEMSRLLGPSTEELTLEVAARLVAAVGKTLFDVSALPPQAPPPSTILRKKVLAS